MRTFVNTPSTAFRPKIYLRLATIQIGDTSMASGVFQWVAALHVRPYKREKGPLMATGCVSIYAYIHTVSLGLAARFEMLNTAS